MGRRKKSNGIQNDRCIICQFCAWEEENNKYICTTANCSNNSKFEMYRPSWMKQDVKIRKDD